jgi:hypothetical protein
VVEDVAQPLLAVAQFGARAAGARRPRPATRRCAAAVARCAPAPRPRCGARGR